jgi:uncharacterized membrane protein
MIAIELAAALLRATIVALIAVAVASAIGWHWIIAGAVAFLAAMLLPVWWERRPPREWHSDNP